MVSVCMCVCMCRWSVSIYILLGVVIRKETKEILVTQDKYKVFLMVYVCVYVSFDILV